MLTTGQVGEGVHSVHVKFTQWNPWPVSMTVTEFPGEGLVTTTVAVRLPPAVGVNVTATMQFEFPASIPPVSGHVVPIAWKAKSPGSAPPKAMLVIDTLEPEWFVSVKDMDALGTEICVPENVRLVGLAVRDGVTVSIPIAEVVPVVAVRVTGVLLLTAPPVTVNVWEFTPARTVTDPDAGTGATAGSPLLRLTTSPPVGAFPLSVTVPVEDTPEATLAGLNESIVTTGGITVRPPPLASPLGSVAVIVTGVLLATGKELTVNVPLLMPPAMVKLPDAGTVTALVLELIKVMVKPAGGAGPFKVTVPMELLPPVMDVGLNVKDITMAGLTARVPFALLVATVAVTITFFAVATPTVVAVKVWEVFVAETVIFVGTVTDGSPLVRDTVIPPVGAAWFSVTVPVELVPPVTDDGLKVTDTTVIPGNTVALPITEVVPVVAVTVTVVELATDPPVTRKV